MDSLSTLNQRMYTPSEVTIHNSSENLWVSFLGNVYNISPLFQSNQDDILMRPLLKVSGQDISHWFDRETNDIKQHMDPTTGCIAPFVPMGRFLHIPPTGPRSDWANNFGKPWWKDPFYFIGLLSLNTRRIRILDTLISKEQILEVCNEETLEEIGNRYLKYNIHGFSYTWKYKGRTLNMIETLDNNGIFDDFQVISDLRFDESFCLPQIQIFFNDDLSNI